MNTKRYFSSLMQTGVRMTILITMLMMAFMGNVASTAALGPLDFNSYTLTSYGGAAQDGACGSGAAIENSGLTLHLTGNCWKKIALAYTVTANTILEFDFQSSAEAEIQGIGFDSDDTINNPQSRIFQVYGNQTYGNLAYNTYAGSGTVHYTIPVGTFYTGSFTHLTFVNDDDAAPLGDSVFSNIQVYEGTPPSLTVTTNGSPVQAPVESYGGAVQDVGATISIENSGLALHVVGNGWKKVAIPYTITADTILEFDFSSGAQGEIHGIGFDVDDTIDNPIRIFQLFGTQAYGNQDFRNYIAGSGTVHYTIPVGTYYTGSFLYLTFVNDQDVASPTGESIFSNIEVYEPSVTNTNPSFDLYAVTGSTTLPGLANPITVWGYNTTNTPVTRPGGPVLVVNQGDSVTITLHNELSEQTTLLLQGQSLIPDLTGAAPAGTATYTFTASKPGTFLYEAGLLPNAQHQVAMGLYGALVVRPTGAPSQAYASSTTAFDTEQVLVLSELDTALHTSADPAAFDMRLYNPKYYLINGEAYPDTDPISVTAGDDVLLRYVNAGLQAHSMSTLGLSQRIIAQDGIANSYARTVVAETIATGQTLDAIVAITGSADQYPLYDASLFLRNNTGGSTFAGLGGMLTMVNVGSPVLPVDTTGPIASTLSITPNTTDASADVIVTANISDAATGNSPVAAAEFYIDTTAGTPTGMTAVDSLFNSPTESVTGTIPVSTLTILAPGLHTIFVRGQDSAGNWGSFETIVLDVDVTPPAAATLHFSTSGSTASGPGGAGADSGDIYYFDGSLFSLGIDAPAGANVDGLDRVSDTDFYMSFTVDVSLPGIGTVQNEDVVHFDGANWTVYFDGTANGLSVSNIDAISVAGGTLYFSLSDTTLPAGVTGVGDDADIYAWDGATYTRLFDATAMGWSGNNVDGFVYVDATHFYLSYSLTGTSVSGLGTVQDEDVVYYDGGSWSMYFDGTVNGLTSTSLDIDAFDIP